MTKEESLRLEKILKKIDKAGEADYRKQEEYNRFCMNTREDWNEEQYRTLRRENPHRSSVPCESCRAQGRSEEHADSIENTSCKPGDESRKRQANMQYKHSIYRR